MRDVTQLHPRLQEKLANLKSNCASAGLKIGISECLRTVSEQDALYAKGRTTSGQKVTNAKGSTYSSMHQWGVAFDFYRNDGRGAYDNSGNFFNKVGEIGKQLGLEWGGDWKKPVDLPHFQLPDWGSTPSELKILYGTPEIFFKSWEMNEMTAEERQELDSLRKKVEALEKNQEKTYHYYSELPDWARPTIEKLAQNGIYAGTSDADLNLPETLMRILVITDRAGVYGK